MAVVLAVTMGACGRANSGAQPATAPPTTRRPTTPAATTRPTTPAATTRPTTTTPPSTPATTTPPQTSLTTTPATTTPPTTAIPVSPQPSAEQAADALVAGWANGNRPFALSVAVPAAVSTLFAVPYPSGNAVFRGCSTAFPPLVCSYGPPALGSGTLFEIYVSQVPSGGWYVSSVIVET